MPDSTPRLLPLIRKVKDAYIRWHNCHATLPKTHRYSLGTRIDAIFIEIIETASAAQFAQKNEKLPLLVLTIRKTDTLRVLLHILWETKSLDDKKYLSLSAMIDEFGRMLGGWHGQLAKQNSSGARPKEK